MYRWARSPREAGGRILLQARCGLALTSLHRPQLIAGGTVLESIKVLRCPDLHMLLGAKLGTQPARAQSLRLPCASLTLFHTVQSVT